MKITQQKRIHTEKGVALLFVVLLTSVLLLVAIGISNISFKELVFSAEARDSDKAFFSADTGVECGLYLDKQGWFGGTPADPVPQCHGDTLTIASSGVSTYQFIVPIDGQCVQVNVNKDFTFMDHGVPTSYTEISSIGYNVGTDGLVPTLCISGPVSSRVVTRALQVHFPNDTGTTGTGTTGTGTTGTGTTGGTGGGMTIPSVTTVSVTGITSTGATLTGNLTDTGGDTDNIGFNYDLASLGTYSLIASAGITTSVGPFSVDLTGLTCGTTYHFIADAFNSMGDASGANITFTTSSCVIPS